MSDVKIVGLENIPDALRDALKGALDGGRNARPSQGEQVVALKEFFARYTGPITFEPGDFVTPRKGSHVSDSGEPYIVLAVHPDAHPNFLRSSPNDAEYGARPQMRVAKVCNCPDGGFMMWWVEAHLFEPWAPKTSDKPNA